MDEQGLDFGATFLDFSASLEMTSGSDRGAGLFQLTRELAAEQPLLRMGLPLGPGQLIVRLYLVVVRVQKAGRVP